MIAAACRWIPPSLCIDALLVGAEIGWIVIAPSSTSVRCPPRGDPAGRIHSRFARVLAGAPWAGKVVRPRVHVRKFVCGSLVCPRWILVERPDAAVASSTNERARSAWTP